MGQVEYMDPDAFDSEPGKIVEPSPPPDEGIDIPVIPSEEPESVETPDSDSKGALGGGTSEVDLAQRLADAEAELAEVRRSFSNQGNELHTLRTALQMTQSQGTGVQQPAQQPQQVEFPDDVDPATAAYFERRLQEEQQKNFFLETARKDAEFKAQKGISKDVEVGVQTYQALNGIMSFKDAYHSMLAQGFVKEDKPQDPNKPTRRVAVEPGRQAPTVVSGGRRAPAAGKLNPDTIDWDKLAKANPQVKMEALRKLHDMTKDNV